MSDRAIGYLLQGKAQTAISNYGNIINWDEHPMGIWNGYSYLPSVAFLAGVPGHKYSSDFSWENVEFVVETGAGELSYYTDVDYSEAGARIESDRKEVMKSGLVMKVEPPSLEEVGMMSMGATLISALQLSVQSEGLIEEMGKKKITTIAWDYIRNKSGIFPLVRAMSEIAGNTAILKAGDLLAASNGRSTMLGGISGVRPSTVVIIGAGTVGEFAARSAMGLGAQVKIFDNRQHRLVRIQQSLGRRVWTSTIQPSVLDEALRSADVAIGALRGEGPRSPMVVSEPMVSAMKEKSVIIDVCIDRGGCFETSRVTSHEDPTYTWKLSLSQ